MNTYFYDRAHHISVCCGTGVWLFKKKVKMSRDKMNFYGISLMFFFIKMYNLCAIWVNPIFYCISIFDKWHILYTFFPAMEVNFPLFYKLCVLPFHFRFICKVTRSDKRFLFSDGTWEFIWIWRKIGNNFWAPVSAISFIVLCLESCH